VSRLVAVAVAALAWSAAAHAASPQQLTITASDGVPLACSLVVPDGAVPAGGWPAVILFHGLGSSHRDMEPLAVQLLAPDGYASLECDARGTGASGGAFDLAGARDVQDTRDLFDWLAARPDISDTAIGAVGISLGGGEVWNAAAAGVPFKAIVPGVAWTDLASALAPEGLAKSGEALYLASRVPQGRWSPDLLAAAAGLEQGETLAPVAQLAAARSARPKLASLTVPTLLVQGRHDFLFDLDQALAAYRLLKGPKHLYLGDVGHPPAANPSAETLVYAAEALKWLDRFVKGMPNGIDTQPPVELAHDPWDGTLTSYKGLPATKVVSVALPGTSATQTGGKVVRAVRITGGPHETFGDSSVTVSYSHAQNWDRLVAVLAARSRGTETVISEGGTAVTGAEGTAKIALMDECVRVPAGARLVVYLGATSKVDASATPVYVADVPAGASITIGREKLRLSVLRKAVSR
jgi:pimeloyl-ACP methyl ester carboxylesterase